MKINTNHKFSYLIIATSFIALAVFIVSNLNTPNLNTGEQKAQVGGEKVVINVKVGDIFEYNTNIFPEIIPNQDRSILEAWEYYKRYYHDTLDSAIAGGDMFRLYHIQIHTNPLILYAEFKKDYKILDEICDMYSKIYQHTEIDSVTQKRTWIFRQVTMPGQDQKVGKEEWLYNGQFMYAAMSLVRVVSNITDDERTDTMNRFLDEYVPFAVELYSRSMDTTHPYNYPRYPHFLTTVKKMQENGPNLKVYTNVLIDTVIWAPIAISELLQANNQNPNIVPIPDAQKTEFLNFAKLTSQVIQSRLSESELTDFTGTNRINGLNIDIGIMDLGPQYEYTGYTGDDCPKEGDPPLRAENVGWDIAHAYRFVYWFHTLNKTKSLYGSSFPDDNVLKGLTNQLIYGAFNKDISSPKFTNFMNGTNGWYAVYWDQNPCRGSKPWSISGAIPAEGYGLWAKYNRDLLTVFLSIYNLNFGPPSFWKNRLGSSNESVHMLAFLASLTPDSLPITYSIKGAPEGVSVDQNGKITWNPNMQQVGLHDLLVNARNSNNQEKSISILLNVFSNNPTPVPDTTPDLTPTPDPSLPTPTPLPDATPTPTPTPPPGGTNGLCGTTLNSCRTGSYSDIEDTGTKYNWSCLGINGGYTATCSQNKYIQPPSNRPPGPISNKINYTAPTINIPTTTVDISMPKLPSWLDFITAFVLDIANDIIRGVKRTGEMLGV